MEINGSLYGSGITGSTSRVNQSSAKDTGKGQTDFKAMLEKFEEEYESNKNKEKSDDWREMDDKEWDKLMGSIDKYIDTHNEELREMKELQQKKALLENRQ